MTFAFGNVIFFLPPFEILRVKIDNGGLCEKIMFLSSSIFWRKNTVQNTSGIKEGNQMKPTKKFAILLLSIIFSIFSTNALFGSSIKSLKKINFSPQLHDLQSSWESGLPVSPWAFCVTEDDLFIISDIEAGNIKVYKINGEFLELVNITGRKGYDLDELSKPTFCFYNKYGSKFGVIDLGIKKIFIYNRIGRMEFNCFKEVFSLQLTIDIQIRGDKILIFGCEPNREAL